MSIFFRLACLAVLLAVAGSPQPEARKAPVRVARATPAIELQDADVVLQASRSSRAPIIERASRSPYSHVGLIEVASDGVFVIEAVQPVSRTPLSAWVARGEGRKVTVLRSALDASARAKVVAEAKAQLGTPYDARYRWDDERLYCSELVVKAFEHGAQLKVGRFEKVKDLALTPAELVFAQRMGVSPEQELVTPGSLVDGPGLDVVAKDAVW